MSENQRWEPYKRKVLESGDSRIRDGAFRISDASHTINMDPMDCGRMLKEMCEKDRTLTLAPPGKSGALRYRIKSKYNFIGMKTRNFSNEELGIVQSHLGAPE
jgi:hypothetical protein